MLKNDSSQEAPGLKDDGIAAPSDVNQEAKKKTASLDNRYHFDEAKLDTLRKEAPWTKDPKFFSSCSISPSAVMKMMMHCQSGVEKGRSKGGNPIEVMGLLMGRPDYEEPKTLVVTDAFPLPIEGFETRVIADDENVVNHMIALGECLERTRKEKFMGWYHSHPFDLGSHSHCFLSQTDLSTQLQWQRAEDPHGNPFVAIVIDPLRSIHTSTPQLKAFRAYPPEYNSSVANQCPNGSVVESEKTRLEHWGSCWNRYYELQVEYFLSTTARGILEQLTQDYLWMRTLGGNNPISACMMEMENDDEDEATRISKLACQLKSIEPSTGGSGGSGSASSSKPPMASMFSSGRAVQVDTQVVGTIASMAAAASMPTAPIAQKQETPLDKAVKQIGEMASQQVNTDTLKHAKQQVFSKSCT